MKWIRKALKGVSLTAAMFVFQACYGTMEGYDEPYGITFRVTAEDTGDPLPNIKVMASNPPTDSAEFNNPGGDEFTDENGLLTFWAYNTQRFWIIDENSVYSTVDTIIDPIDADTVNIVMSKAR